MINWPWTPHWKKTADYRRWQAGKATGAEVRFMPMSHEMQDHFDLAFKHMDDAFAEMDKVFKR